MTGKYTTWPKARLTVYHPRRRGCLYLSAFEGGSYVLHETENQEADGPAPGRLHRAPRNRLSGALGQNADDARHHRHYSAIYSGVGEGAAASGQGGNAYPG